MDYDNWISNKGWIVTHATSSEIQCFTMSNLSFRYKHKVTEGGCLVGAFASERGLLWMVKGSWREAIPRLSSTMMAKQTSQAPD